MEEDQSNIQQQLRAIAGNSSYVWAHIPDENCHLIGAIEKERFPFSFARRTIVNAVGKISYFLPLRFLLLFLLF